MLLGGAALAAATWIGAAACTFVELRYLYYDRGNLPDLGSFARLEFPTIGHIYDSQGQPLIELAHEYRHITQYADIPPVVRDAILAAEDKRFFSHDGVDFFSIPRVIGKVRLGAWGTRLATGGRRDNTPGPAIFPQGGSTITQQLVRGVFLQRQTGQENSYQLRTLGLLPRVLSSVIGARNANMMIRKREEIRLSLWIEQEMRKRFGSKRRAKEEILARYASFVYMGGGQYGFARAAEYYFGRPLSTFTADDADKAALLAGIAKSPRDYAPTATDTRPILRRRNQILALMAVQGFLPADRMADAQQRSLVTVPRRVLQPFQSSAVVDHVLDELHAVDADLGIDDLLQGRIQVHSTVDARAQRIVSDALEHGLESYEQRHPSARGVVQGSVVVLKNQRREHSGRDRRPAPVSGPSDVLQRLQSRHAVDAAAGVGDEADRVSGRVPVRGLHARVGRARRADQRAKRQRQLAEMDFELRRTLQRPDPDSGRARRIEKRRRDLDHGTDWDRRGPAHVTQPRRADAFAALRDDGAGRLGGQLAGTGDRLSDDRVRRAGAAARRFGASSRRIGRSDARQAGHRRSRSRLARRDARADSGGPAGRRAHPDWHGARARLSGVSHAVMGKTGTTSEFKDALFVGSTYGADGVTVAVRIGFDDNRSLGAKETGGRVALPVFREVMLGMYRDQIAGPVPSFPQQMEHRITQYVRDASSAIFIGPPMLLAATSTPRQPAAPAEESGQLPSHSVVSAASPRTTSSLSLNPIRNR